MRLKLVTIILASGLTACSTQNWYQGAQSAQSAHCLKEPLSEYEDCNQPTKETYDSYQDKREQLLEENKAD